MDGEFINGIFGTIERWTAGDVYSENETLDHIISPLAYIGTLTDIPIPTGQVVDYWLGPCGAYVVHFRAVYQDENWASYPGRDPRLANKKEELVAFT